MYYAISNPELQHFGVKGMKWGVRNYQNKDGSLTSAGRRQAAKNEYKKAKKDYKQTLKANKLSFKQTVMAGASNERARKNYINKENKAALNKMDKKAQYAASKKSNTAKAEKAEIKSYAKTMRKSGLSGSVNDQRYGGRSTKIYKHLEKTKGREYADKVEKQVTKEVIKQALGIAAAGVAAQVAVNAYAKKQGY